MTLTHEQLSEDAWLKNYAPSCPGCGHELSHAGEACTTCCECLELQQAEAEVFAFRDRLQGLSNRHLADLYCSHVERTSGYAARCAVDSGWFYCGQGQSARCHVPPCDRASILADIERLAQLPSHATKRSPGC